MSITAMPMPEAQPTSRRPQLRLLPDLRERTTEKRARRTAPARPGDLDAVRIEADLVAHRACRSIGVRGTWGTSRWRATEDPDTVVSSFEIRVAGEVPCLEVAQQISQRLAEEGWSGGIRAMTPIVRIDAERDGFRLRLVATRRTVTVSITGRPVTLGAKLAQEVLDGLYEED